MFSLANLGVAAQFYKLQYTQIRHVLAQMQKLFNIILLFSLIGLFPKNADATRDFGGEITWKCLGTGAYVFELHFYRDCNGFDVNTNYETIQVWGHPTLTTIKVNYISREDLSPACTPSGGATALDCGTGATAGNGPGAIEKIIYRSDPITITGNPPSGGWNFTFQNFSRSSTLTNLQNPNTLGMTISSTMYPIPGAAGGQCIDNSPTFLQLPYMISCAGDPYDYNPNTVDVDLDSLHFKWGNPLNYFPSGSFSPPTNPAPVPFVSGYSFTNPTPDASFNPGNQAATLNPQTGQIQFKSNTLGEFAIKIVVDSYRNGVKIASVERESPIIVESCSGGNTPPTITPPFSGGTSFETTIFAGDAVNFTLKATDVGLLQDGVTPQTISITSSGMMYGASFTDVNNGCGTTPCATLQSTPPITSTNDATALFNWQTSCDHLKDASGNMKNKVSYVFVFKIQDDYCPIPMVRYSTVTIHLKNKDVLPATKIDCITTNAAGDIIIQWDPISDPFGSFGGYEINGVTGGNYGIIANISGNSFTIPAGSVANVDQFFISTKSGCGGNTRRNSDTLSNIFLDLNNPGNGVAVLDWNDPSPNPLSSFADLYYIYKEFPAGNWTLIDSVPYNTTLYFDTITVCQEFINYQIVLPTSDCNFTSNIAGDIFKDKIVPDIPNITNVDIDTLSSDITIQWDENRQKDTYGYVIYKEDINGNLVEIDTVWGRSNTNYTYYENPENGPFLYSVAAFDSCYTPNIPPTHQTSAKAEPHTTNFLTTSLDICSHLVNLNWTGYIGFNNIDNNLIFARINNGSWQQMGQSNSNSFSMDISVGDEMLIAVQTISNKGVTSFSNVDTVQFEGSPEPSMSYLGVATVEDDYVKVEYHISYGEGVKLVQLERWSIRTQSFNKIDEKKVNNLNVLTFIDNNVEVNKRSYTYRAKVIDTCNRSLGYSNIGKTIYLNVITNQEAETHTLQWTPYEDFIGNLHQYEIYRSIDDQFSPTPIAVLPYNLRTYTDSIAAIGQTDDGKICYQVIAVEASNKFGVAHESFSNRVCGTIEPTIYIPNAFTVGGHNPVFKPITREHQTGDYLFEIYDRYGRIIFSTTDPDKGWNGQLRDQKRIASEGVYVYRLSLIDGNGIQIIKYGHVTLLDYRGVGE